MKKSRLYLSTFFVTSLIILACSFFAFKFSYRTAKENLLESKMEAGKRESREIGKLLELQLAEGISKEKVIQNLQNSIANTDTQSGFICMYDTKGIEICHPNPALIGKKIDKENSKFLTDKNESLDFNKILIAGNNSSGIRDFPESENRSSEIVSVYPVYGSDWMLASHTNIAVLEKEISSLYKSFLMIFMFSSLVILSFSFFLIRLIYRKYERRNEEQINRLNNEIIELSALEQQLKSLQSKEKTSLYKAEDKEIRKRISIYHKDELISLETSDIAYFIIEENLVSIMTFDHKKYTSTSSLDELTRSLDPEIFYRANRQSTINIKAISNILIYSKNQLKLLTRPEIQNGIIISKNRVSDFKKWLEQ